VDVYWRLPLPTLRELWPSVTPHAHEPVLRSWGALLRRIHTVQFRGHGPLGRDTSGPRPFDAFLARDLAERLEPAVIATWPDAHHVVRMLAAHVGEVTRRASAGAAALVHNDLHMGNVLCVVNGGVIQCVGVLDLEWATAGPPEADLARVQVLHGPLFAQSLDGSWFETLLQGYGNQFDPLVLSFYRAYHLLNLGYHAASTGLGAHASTLLEAATTELAVNTGPPACWPGHETRHILSSHSCSLRSSSPPSVSLPAASPP
jgi:aminoglycoside phosphotransferase (APT) family kinase protein